MLLGDLLPTLAFEAEVNAVLVKGRTCSLGACRSTTERRPRRWGGWWSGATAARGRKPACRLSHCLLKTPKRGQQSSAREGERVAGVARLAGEAGAAAGLVGEIKAREATHRLIVAADVRKLPPRMQAVVVGS